MRILARFFAARYHVDHKYTATLIARTQFDLNGLWLVKILGASHDRLTALRIKCVNYE